MDLAEATQPALNPGPSLYLQARFRLLPHSRIAPASETSQYILSPWMDGCCSAHCLEKFGKGGWGNCGSKKLGSLLG